MQYKSLGSLLPLPFIKNHNGDIITVNDLPNFEKNVRWTAEKKALIIEIVKKNILSEEEVLKKYFLTKEEFNCWKKRYKEGGTRKLQMKHIALQYGQVRRKKRER
jgi:Protein of unknown function (DUF1153)